MNAPRNTDQSFNLDSDIRILVVDDNAGDLELVESCLKEDRRVGVLLTKAGSVADAIQSLRSHPFDVVLLDLGLPDSVGTSALEEVRRIVPRIPVIVLSGQSDAKVVTRALQEGAQDYLSKDGLSCREIHRAIRFARDRSRFALGRPAARGSRVYCRL